MLVALAFAAAPAAALGQVEIPLDSAISPQYHAAEAAAAVESAVAAVPAAPAPEPVAPPAPPAPAAAAPEPVDNPESVPQYHAPNKGEYQAQETPADAPSQTSAPEPPAEPAAASQPADEKPRANGLDLGDVAKQPAIPDGDAVKLEQPDVSKLAGLAQPVDPPATPDASSLLPGVSKSAGETADASPQPTISDLAGVVGLADMPARAAVRDLADAAVAPINLNVSLRIFSPGDDGPVTQIVQGGAAAPSSPVSAPTTWIWNWHWTGAPGCIPGQPGSIAPELGVAGWTWNWVWSCHGPAGDASGPGLPPIVGLTDIDEFVPGIGHLPGMPDFDALPGLESLASLPGIAGAIPFTTSPGFLPGKPAADAPASRAARERPGAPSNLASLGYSAAWAQAHPSGGVAAFVAPSAAAVKGAERAQKRGKDRDISRDHRLISADLGSPAPALAVASAAAAAGAGGSSAVLTTLILLFLSYLAGALVTGVGLPRLKLRATRLERPG